MNIESNSGSGNSGSRNSGSRNSGNWNSGSGNSGSRNSGSRNSGNWNSGNWNSGNWNSGNWNSGFFNVGQHQFAFDKPVTKEQIDNAKWPDWLYFNLTEWICTSSMTDDEKKTNPSHITTGGFLRVYDYKDAAKKSYDKATREDQLLITKFPNYAPDIFEKIFGFRVEEKTPSLSGKKVKVELDGKSYTATID